MTTLQPKKIGINEDGTTIYAPVLVNSMASPEENGVTPVVNGEIGIDQLGLIIIQNKQGANSLFNIFNELLSGLTVFTAALAADPAAAAAAAALALTIVTVQTQVAALLSPTSK